ncbi:response regulator [Pseudanabaena minima]|uniref:response regulator n=1 Tax=Pseudanabaena minima TaxID=890415 RepID=UPI003DA7AD0A
MAQPISTLTHTKTILLIDDDEMSRWLVQLCLENFVNWQIQVAISGKAGLAAITQAEPDVILLDIMMPDMDGFTFMQKLKADKLHAHIPIVALTSSTSRFRYQTFIDLGCQGVISKPFNPITLGSKISQILGW